MRISWVLREVSAFTASIICGKIPGLTLGQQKICQQRPDIMVLVGDGTRIGMEECRRQFKHKRWNCTAVGSSSVFGHVVVLGSREAAYTYAITAAGVTHAITRACNSGTVHKCSCDASRSGRVDANGGFKWGGCSADVKNGMRMSRYFLDAREIDEDDRALMNLHNNKVGRRAVLQTIRTQCKCHGVSGSCTMKTCWNMLPLFEKTGDYLMHRYLKAKRVVAINDSNSMTFSRQSRPLYLKTRKSRLKPRQKDLVFLDPSPNYCEADPLRGSPGTVGRHCNRTSRGMDGCDLLCCGRGYNTHQFTKDESCRCKFNWCCYVSCERCIERTEVYSCK